MTDFWCKYHQLFALHLPAMFHTASIWLTCYLAIQRFCFVFFPVFMLCYTNVTNNRIICGLFLWAGISVLPKMCMKNLRNHPGRSGKKYCIQVHTDFIDRWVGFHSYNMWGYVYKLLFIHIIPCFILVIFTVLLFLKLRLQDKKRERLLHKSGEPNNEATSGRTEETVCDQRAKEGSRLTEIERRVSGSPVKGKEDDKQEDEGLGEEVLGEPGEPEVRAVGPRGEILEELMIEEILVEQVLIEVILKDESGEKVVNDLLVEKELIGGKGEDSNKNKGSASQVALNAEENSTGGPPNPARPIRLMQTSSKLLFIIVIIHLLVELPVAVVLFGRFWAGQFDYDLKGTMFATEFTNAFMVVRNFLIIITYPFNFTIYFGMSSNFKNELLSAYCMRFLLRRRRRASESDDWGRRFSMPVTRSSESTFSRSRRMTADQRCGTPATDGSDDSRRDVIIAGCRSQLYDESCHSEHLL
ncbi:hypothetical protein PMAYCL1PPCAC_32576 [Pristionchus mayeri]|uniref:G-protein coupled receptors family 1 profile domain-containing protein n=1 Tax=Pristionchus mayeri TaxID=1317129 RepID=A0AAN5DG85_9BILA|nr:hypothetical protein PMAYCL1PPCAC_32576 [Pristionchus mayeri]